MGEGAPLSWRPSAVADAGNGPDGPPPTPSRQGRSGGTVWRDSRSPCLSSPHPTLPPPGGKGQYFAGVLGMTAPVDTERYKHHRFPGAIISHGVWLSYRFTRSYESITKLGAAAGLQTAPAGPPAGDAGRSAGVMAPQGSVPGLSAPPNSACGERQGLVASSYGASSITRGCLSRPSSFRVTGA